METKHTPGPWRINPEDKFEFGSEAWGGIGFVHNEPAENEDLLEMARANARLIAAAPDLLQCLLAYVEQEEQAAPYSSSPMREKARAAIAKATQETP